MTKGWIYSAFDVSQSSPRLKTKFGFETRHDVGSTKQSSSFFEAHAMSLSLIVPRMTSSLAAAHNSKTGRLGLAKVLTCQVVDQA